MLSWGMTIHKAEGHEFDGVVVHLDDCNTQSGMIYTALSRAVDHRRLAIVNGRDAPKLHRADTKKVSHRYAATLQSRTDGVRQVRRFHHGLDLHLQGAISVFSTPRLHIQEQDQPSGQKGPLQIDRQQDEDDKLLDDSFDSSQFALESPPITENQPAHGASAYDDDTWDKLVQDLPLEVACSRSQKSETESVRIYEDDFWDDAVAIIDV